MEKPENRPEREAAMALVLIFSALLAGGGAAALTLWVGWGFLAALGVYLVCGSMGMALAAGLLWWRAARRPADLPPPARWGLSAPEHAP